MLEIYFQDLANGMSSPPIANDMLRVDKTHFVISNDNDKYVSKHKSRHGCKGHITLLNPLVQWDHMLGA